MTAIEHGKAGQRFDDFLKEQGTYEETTERAIKQVVAFQIEQAMKNLGISKVEMATRLKTSRSQLDRLLDPSHTAVTLETLSRAAQAVGRTLTVELN